LLAQKAQVLECIYFYHVGDGNQKEAALAAALKLAGGAQLARAKSEAFKIIYKYRVGDGNQGAVFFKQALLQIIHP